MTSTSETPSDMAISNPAGVTSASMLDRAKRVADDMLFPDAAAVDRADLLDRRRLDPLADAGLFGIAGPASLGFAELDPWSARRVIATVGGGCGATFFCWVQHHGVVRTVTASTNPGLRDELLVDMCAGSTMAGVAFAHLRRSDRRAITATRVDGGWRLDGFAPWATSWGVADLFAVAAESTDGQVVWAILPGTASDTVRPTPLALPVLSSTGTVALTFDECIVPDDRIALTEDVAEWRARDRARASIGQPAVLGVTDRAIRLLRDAARSDGDAANDAADDLASRLSMVWANDDEVLRLLTNDPSEESIAVASRHRATCLELAGDATAGLLAAVGGAGMDLSHPAQRLAREASFYVIQAQTADGRAAVLRHVGRSAR